MLSSFGGVVSFDFRGHGRSAGYTTVGDREVLDLKERSLGIDGYHV